MRTNVIGAALGLLVAMALGAAISGCAEVAIPSSSDGGAPMGDGGGGCKIGLVECPTGQHCDPVFDVCEDDSIAPWCVSDAGTWERCE